ncbi:MAG: invasion associated locus B family protein [Micavibrio aeruginosavorus]|uniref:Invasion associated locus B family protein n=1 Tax=Micavibrio aeruginosavorus TaxID=349221 RepID=A0A7T5UIH6_9BACT|nr:MAG: invasion associated locus B family protein [Micavibrio aeruginosavorus]
MKKSFKYSLLSFLCYAAAVPASVWAQTPDAGSAWVKRCEGQGREQVCEMVYRLMEQDSGTRVLEFAIGFSSQKDSARAVLIAPLGVELEQGFTITVDGKDNMAVKPRYCLSDGCYAFLLLPPDVLAILKKGKEAVLSFNTFDGQPARLPIALEGFASTVAEILK